MKFTALRRYSPTSKPTSFHAVLGSREAREFSLTDETGNERQILFLNVLGGLMLAPVISQSDTLEYNGYKTVVCSNGRLFFGQILNAPTYSTWYTTKAEKIDASFHQACDLLTE